MDKPIADKLLYNLKITPSVVVEMLIQQNNKVPKVVKPTNKKKILKNFED